MESTLNQFNNVGDVDLSTLVKNEKSAEKIFLNLINQLCYDRSNSISGKPNKLEILKNTLDIDLGLLDSALHYDQLAQKIWLDDLAKSLEEAAQPSSKIFKTERNRIINQQVAYSIRLIGQIYEEKNERLIEQLKELLNKKLEDTQHKLSVVEEKLEKLTKPQDVAMRMGYSNLFAKDKEGFAIPLSKNAQEKKRELKDQKSDQSSKRRELEKDTQKEKENKPENNESSSASTCESQNNGYQSN